MHLTTTNPVSGVWHQNTRAGVIPAISFTRLLRRNARISAHAMRMRAYARIFAHAMRMRAYTRIFAHAMRMRAFPRMRCECAHIRAFSRMRCECAHMRAFRACDANARTCAHFPACDAMRMRACDAMRMRASRGNLCVSGTVVCAILWNKCCYISLSNDPAYSFSKYGSPTKASFHNIPLKIPIDWTRLLRPLLVTRPSFRSSSSSLTGWQTIAATWYHSQMLWQSDIQNIWRRLRKHWASLICAGRRRHMVGKWVGWQRRHFRFIFAQTCWTSRYFVSKLICQ